MKFCKRYRDYMQRLQDRLPGVSYVEFKKLKKILKHCTVKSHKQSSTRFPLDEGNSSNEVHDINTEDDGVGRPCRTCCPGKLRKTLFIISGLIRTFKEWKKKGTVEYFLLPLFSKSMEM
jgi:hypothetical protein